MPSTGYAARGSSRRVKSPSQSPDTSHRGAAARARAERRRSSDNDQPSLPDNVLDLTELRRQRAREAQAVANFSYDEPAVARQTRVQAKPKAKPKARVAAAHKVKTPCAPCHWGLIFTTLFLALLSIPVVYSASQASALDTYHNSNYYLVRQTGFVAVGLLFMLGASRLSAERLRAFVWILYAGSLLGLLAIQFTPLGLSMGSTERWLKLGPVQFQVSELAKVALIGVLADFWSRASITARGKSWPWLVALGLALPIVGLVVKQPHLSAALVLITIPIIIGFYAGAPMRHFGYLFGGIAVLGGLLVVLSAVHALPSLPIYKYQTERITHFLNRGGDTKEDDRGAHYQTAQGLRAIARGGWTGVGPGGSLFKQGHLPAPHTDFILAIIGEEGGFIGMFGLLACYGAMILFCFQIGHVTAKPFESLLCAGVGSLLAMQVLCNTSVVLKILPVTGMQLPLISYGGSGLLCCMLALGLVLGISRQSAAEEKAEEKRQESA